MVGSHLLAMNIHERKHNRLPFLLVWELTQLQLWQKKKSGKNIRWGNWKHFCTMWIILTFCFSIHATYLLKPSLTEQEAELGVRAFHIPNSDCDFYKIAQFEWILDFIERKANSSSSRPFLFPIDQICYFSLFFENPYYDIKYLKGFLGCRYSCNYIF